MLLCFGLASQKASTKVYKKLRRAKEVMWDNRSYMVRVTLVGFFTYAIYYLCVKKKTTKKDQDTKKEDGINQKIIDDTADDSDDDKLVFLKQPLDTKLADDHQYFESDVLLQALNGLFKNKSGSYNKLINEMTSNNKTPKEIGAAVGEQVKKDFDDFLETDTFKNLANKKGGYLKDKDQKNQDILILLKSWTGKVWTVEGDSYVIPSEEDDNNL